MPGTRPSSQIVMVHWRMRKSVHLTVDQRLDSPGEDAQRKHRARDITVFTIFNLIPVDFGSAAHNWDGL